MIKTYGQCALQAKFAYIDKVPQKQSGSATFGTCLHDALEHYGGEGDMEKAVQRFLYTWDNPEVLGVKPDFYHKRVTHGGLRELGVKILTEYHETSVWQDREIIAQEHRFCVPVGKYLFSGVVDLLEAKRGDSRKLRIVDFKSSSRKPNRDTLHMDIQFSLYCLASMQPEFWMGYDDGTDECRDEDGNPKYVGLPNGEELYERFKDADRIPIWFHLRTGEEINCGPRDDLDFMRLYKACEEIEKAVTHEVFVPSISGDTCSFCSYKDICGSYIPSPHGEEEEA